MPQTPQQPPAEHWLYWQDGAHSPAWNMAADETMLQQVMRIGVPLLRTYAWDQPAVSIGYVQRHDAAPEGYAYVRRPTGGGVVYHDWDFTYSVAFPPNHWLNGLDRIRSYDWINRSLQHALRGLNLPVELAQTEIPHSVERATMVCFTNPTRYDLLLNGQKIAGSAQRRTAEGLLHQGSVHFGQEGLPFSRSVLAKALLDGLREVMQLTFTPFLPDSGFEDAVQRLVAEKYGTDAWNQLR